MSVWQYLLALTLLCAAEITSYSAPNVDPCVALVSKLYASYSWETSEHEDYRRTTFHVEKRGVLERYVTPALATLLRYDRVCIERTHELCKLNFAPLWDSQDPGGATYTVRGIAGSSSVAVWVTYAYDGKHEILFDCVRVAGGWRIDNIRTKDWSLRDLLSAK